MNDAQDNLPATRQPADVIMTPGQILQGAITGNISSDKVEVVERLLQMQLDQEDRDMRVMLARAFGELQYDCKKIACTKTIPGRNGEIRSTFAPIEEIKDEMFPLLAKHKFTYDAKQELLDGGKLTKATVIITHVPTGREKSSSFTCREQASPGNTPAQNDGGTFTFAERKAIANLLGLRFDHSADARDLGDTITPEDAADLERRVRAIYPNDARQVERVLKLADAKDFASIKFAKYDVVLTHLEAIERKPSTKPAVASTASAPPDAEKLFRACLGSWTGLSGDDFRAAAREVAAANGITDIAKANSVQFSNLAAFVNEQVENENYYFKWSASNKKK